MEIAIEGRRREERTARRGPDGINEKLELKREEEQN